MRVLIACERFGVIRDAFINAGYDAWSCDIVDSEVPGPHIRGDALKVMGWGWDLMIAHPDCTYLTSSAEWAYSDGPYHQQVKPDTLVGEARREARREALAFVEALAAAPVQFIAIENPAVGALNKRLDLTQYGFRSNFPTQVIQPHQYGHDASKATGLALKGLPDLEPTLFVEPRMVLQPSGRTLPRWANQTDSGQNRLSPGGDRAMARAKTYQGWADAMVTQWAPLVATAVVMEEAA
ncbi:hypothetical protein ACL00X_11155 [Aeromonas diversa]|uniref:hypothetical protein n=1 Tax=Aeromonas diversa TaxID=502790 RepID=UPI00399F90A9